MQSDWKKNYAIIVPLDVSRHPDGTAISVVHPDDKPKAIEYIEKNVGINAYEKMTGKQKEEVLAAWRIVDNIDTNKKFTNNWEVKQ